MSGLVEPAAPKACAACPWRLSNQGLRHAGGWYSKANLRRLWSGLRQGERMTCHPTDPRMNECFGGEGTVRDDVVTHECTGSLILAQREMMVVQHRFSMDFRAYRRTRPRGLSQWGIAALISRVVFGGVPVLGDRLPVARPDLADAEIGYAPLVGWEVGCDTAP